MSARRHPLADGNPPPWASAWGDDEFGVFVEIVVHGVSQRLRWIPPGRFRMGSPPEETKGLAQEKWENDLFDAEQPRHEVVIEAGFWLFDTPVTQGLWEAVMGSNPSEFVSPERPVERVNWREAMEFIGKLNAAIPGLGLSLPSEAQWEYACRAGTETAVYSGELEILGERNAPALDAIAWYGGNSGEGYELSEGWNTSDWKEQQQYPNAKAGTREVKGKAASGWGLYDMLGNVWEWTQDHWHDDYEGAPDDGRAWLSEEADAHRVLRGGSGSSLARYVRCACRDRLHPGVRYDNIGFRCARVQGEPRPAEPRAGAEAARRGEADAER